MTEDNDLIAAMIESGHGAITGRSRTWLNSQVAQALTTARAEAEALRSLLAEIVPPKLIGESHDPYPEGKTTIIMDWDWLKRTRAALSKGPTQ